MDRNRVKEALGEEPEEKKRPAGDYFVVSCRCDTFMVSPETARRVSRALDRRFFRPRWIKLVDLNGARVWIRTDTVESVSESTELGRQTGRELQRALRQEEKADRRWDEDEYW